jgi:predicted sulfurtransferase
LSPHEFHDILSSNRDLRKKALITEDSCSGIDVANNKRVHLEKVFKEQELILLDVRNYYETRVGRFQLQDNSGAIVGSAIDPRTRQVRTVRIPAGSYRTSNT